MQYSPSCELLHGHAPPLSTQHNAVSHLPQNSNKATWLRVTSRPCTATKYSAQHSLPPTAEQQQSHLVAPQI